MKEFKEPTNPENKNVFIIRCWNALRTLAENKSLVENREMLLKFDELLIPAYNQLNDPKDVVFDDDILDIIITSAKMVGYIAPKMKECIIHFPKILSKYNGQIAQLLSAYNSYFLHARDVFENAEIRDMTINIGIRATTEPNDQMVDMHKTEGVLLFHLILQIISEYLSEPDWIKI